jgi:hypothetical protein
LAPSGFFGLAQRVWMFCGISKSESVIRMDFFFLRDWSGAEALRGGSKTQQKISENFR